MPKHRAHEFFIGLSLIVTTGCGGRHTAESGATSEKELVEFLEENPTYSKPNRTSDSAEATLELGQ